MTFQKLQPSGDPRASCCWLGSGLAEKQVVQLHHTTAGLTQEMKRLTIWKSATVCLLFPPSSLPYSELFSAETSVKSNSGLKNLPGKRQNGGVEVVFWCFSPDFGFVSSSGQQLQIQRRVCLLCTRTSLESFLLVSDSRSPSPRRERLLPQAPSWFKQTSNSHSFSFWVLKLDVCFFH